MICEDSSVPGVRHTVATHLGPALCGAAAGGVAAAVRLGIVRRTAHEATITGYPSS